MAKYSAAQNKATQKYIHNNYEQISIRLKKDGYLTRSTIQMAADKAGTSLNGYILEAVEKRLYSDGFKKEIVIEDPELKKEK